MGNKRYNFLIFGNPCYPGHVAEFTWHVKKAYQSDHLVIPQGVFDAILSKGWSSTMPRFNNYCESVLK